MFWDLSFLDILHRRTKLGLEIDVCPVAVVAEQRSENRSRVEALQTRFINSPRP